MPAEHRPGWFDPDRLDPARQRAAAAYLRQLRPIGVVGQGERNDAFLVRLTVRSSGTFESPGLEPWGVLETLEHGAVIVPSAIASATMLPTLPVPLRRLGARIGPTTRRLEVAQRAVEERPAVRRIRDRFVAAAVAHATLHRQLEAWTPDRPTDA